MHVNAKTKGLTASPDLLTQGRCGGARFDGGAGCDGGAGFDGGVNGRGGGWVGRGGGDDHRGQAGLGVGGAEAPGGERGVGPEAQGHGVTAGLQGLGELPAAELPWRRGGGQMRRTHHSRVF